MILKLFNQSVSYLSLSPNIENYWLRKKLQAYPVALCARGTFLPTSLGIPMGWPELVIFIVIFLPLVGILN